MTSEMVLLSLIDWPARDKTRRTYSKEFEGHLAQGIAVEGLLQPIGIRPNPEKEGRYTGVFGEHRFGACKLLKWEAIEAKVFVDMDTDDAEMARDAENLWRNELSGAQRSVAIKRWYEQYAAKHPDMVGRGGKRAGSGRPKKADDAEKTESGEEKESNAESAFDSLPSFPKQLAEATGVSLRTAVNEAQVAKAFTEDQLFAFEQCGVNKTDQLEIAKIKDEKERHACVNLIIGGYSVEDAIKRALNPVAPKYVVPGPGCPAEELLDDEWFRVKCGTLADTLANPAAYKADALFYREIAETRQIFVSHTKKSLKNHHRAKPGPFYRMVRKMSTLSHPCDWLRCGTCKGTGSVSEGKTCLSCYGDGYTTKTEG